MRRIVKHQAAAGVPGAFDSFSCFVMRRQPMLRLIGGHRRTAALVLGVVAASAQDHGHARLAAACEKGWGPSLEYKRGSDGWSTEEAGASWPCMGAARRGREEELRPLPNKRREAAGNGKLTARAPLQPSGCSRPACHRCEAEPTTSRETSYATTPRRKPDRPAAPPCGACRSGCPPRSIPPAPTPAYGSRDHDKHTA